MRQGDSFQTGERCPYCGTKLWFEAEVEYEDQGYDGTYYCPRCGFEEIGTVSILEAGGWVEEKPLPR